MLTIFLEIITPQGTIYKGDVILVTVRTISGYQGILPNHAPLVSSLIGGDLTVHIDNNKQLKYYVGSGLLVVEPKYVRILTDKIENSKISK